MASDKDLSVSLVFILFSKNTTDEEIDVDRRYGDGLQGLLCP